MITILIEDNIKQALRDEQSKEISKLLEKLLHNIY